MNIRSMKHKYIFWISPLAILALTSCGKPKKQTAALPPTPVSVAEAKKAEAIYLQINRVKRTQPIGHF